jgi:accessory colonization factor AcfC
LKGRELDIVIPSTKILDKSPDRSLVIQVVREDLAAKLGQAETVQPYRENIWLVSANKLQTDYKNYHLGPDGLQIWFLISDVNKFLSEKGSRGLKMLHGQ